MKWKVTMHKFPAPEAAHVCVHRSLGHRLHHGAQSEPRGPGCWRSPGAAPPAGPEEGARPRQHDGKAMQRQPEGKQGRLQGPPSRGLGARRGCAQQRQLTGTWARGWLVWWGVSCTSSLGTPLSCRGLLHFNDFKGDFLNALFTTRCCFH